MHTSVREINTSSESDSSYFLRVDWEGRSLGSGFQMLLTDGQDAWRGEVSQAAVNSEAEELELKKEKYIHDLHQALTGAENSPSYSFTLTPDPPHHSGMVKLTYEKMQKEISFRLGCVPLKAVADPVKAVRELLLHGLQRGDALQQQNHKLEEENQRLIQEQQRITAEMKLYASSKEALETKLFSRFVLVMNEKKAKIRSLQETVTNLQETRSSDRQNNNNPGKSEQRAGRDNEVDVYGGSTDDEPEEEQPTPASNIPSRDSFLPQSLPLQAHWTTACVTSQTWPRVASGAFSRSGPRIPP
ncbi:DNA repair protein XRCC4 isoform 2-T3 [Odontesthes bonariensis]|uniref:DNA repair protein XRCC4 isoform X2 n=1 Tax=Odontesthes bonariensis TaxID=219752 RepID=UPI003F581C76